MSIEVPTRGGLEMASVCCLAKVLFGGICSKCGEPCDEQFFLEADEDGVWLIDENGDRHNPENDLNNEACGE